MQKGATLTDQYKRNQHVIKRGKLDRMRSDNNWCSCKHLSVLCVFANVGAACSLEHNSCMQLLLRSSQDEWMLQSLQVEGQAVQGDGTTHKGASSTTCTGAGPEAWRPSASAWCSMDDACIRFYRFKPVIIVWAFIVIYIVIYVAQPVLVIAIIIIRLHFEACDLRPGWDGTHDL